MDLIFKFFIIDTIVVLAILELLIYLQPKSSVTGRISVVRILIRLVCLAAMMSPWIIVPYLTGEQRSGQLKSYYMIWIILFLSYVFLRVIPVKQFKAYNQAQKEDADNKSSAS